MGFQEWGKDELKKVTEELKKIPVNQRKAVRDSIKDLSAASEALAVVRTVSTLISNISENPVSPSETSARASEGVSIDNSTNHPISDENRPETSVNTSEGLERVHGDIIEDNKLNLSEISGKITTCITNYCLNNGMESDSELIKSPQRIWGAVSNYIGKNTFNNSRILFDTHKPNKIDIDKVAQVLPLYFSLCDRYNKAVLIDYVAYFLGLSDDWIYKNMEKLTTYGIDLAKKREDSLTACIVDGKQSPVGALAVLNHYHGWNTASRTEKITEKTIVYPALISSDGLKIGVASGEK